jgi:hypothetical protein
MAFPRLGGFVNRVKKVATTPIRLPRRKVASVAPRPASMPINAGKRLAGGMTSATRMPTQLSATRRGARALAKKPITPIARPNVQAFRGSRFIPGKGVSRKTYSTPKPTNRFGFMNRSN